MMLLPLAIRLVMAHRAALCMAAAGALSLSGWLAAWSVPPGSTGPAWAPALAASGVLALVARRPPFVWSGDRRPLDGPADPAQPGGASLRRQAREEVYGPGLSLTVILVIPALSVPVTAAAGGVYAVVLLTLLWFIAWLARKGPEWSIATLPARALWLGIKQANDAPDGRPLLAAAVFVPILLGQLPQGLPPLAGVVSLPLIALAVRPHLAAARAEHVRLLSESARLQVVRSQPPSGSGGDVGEPGDEAGSAAFRVTSGGSLPVLARVGGYAEEKLQVTRWVTKVRAAHAQSEAAARGEVIRNRIGATGALLHGSPGVGKSLLVRAACGSVGISVMEVKGSELRRPHVGVSGARLSAMFDQAAAAAPVVVIIDEIDAILKDRGGEGARTSVDDELSEEFLVRLQNLPPGVAVAGTTNFVEALDPAARSRFDLQLRVPMPDRLARIAILEVALERHTSSHAVDLEAVADAIDGLSGRRIDQLVQDAAAASALTDDHDITTGDLIDASRSRVQRAIDHSPVSWDEVVQPLAIIEALQSFAETVRDPSAVRALGGEPPRGLLLDGPSGTGKTLLVKAIRTAVSSGSRPVSLIIAKGPDLGAGILNVTAKNITKLFEEAREAAPCIVFIDEVDALAGNRSGDVQSHSDDHKSVNALLQEMEGVDTDSRQVVLIAATNLRSRLDPAFLSRMSEQIHVGLPDVAGRERILAVHLRRTPLDGDVDLHALAQASEGASGRDLKSTCDRAIKLAARRRATVVEQHDLLAALRMHRAA
jgi:SpoVK/Ycf46/Vps4 family AAA+-type ATPase